MYEDSISQQMKLTGFRLKDFFYSLAIEQYIDFITFWLPHFFEERESIELDDKGEISLVFTVQK